METLAIPLILQPVTMCMHVNGVSSVFFQMVLRRYLRGLPQNVSLQELHCVHVLCVFCTRQTKDETETKNLTEGNIHSHIHFLW